MTAFFAIAMDVPRKIRTSWLFWILIVLIALVLAFFGLSINVRPDTDGLVATWWGEEIREQALDGFHRADAATKIPEFLGGFVGFFCACFVGVFAGLILLADAVSSAFAAGQAELNLPKPVNRATIVLARHLGALLVATFFATLLVGGGIGVTYLKTKILAVQVFAYIPVSVAIFGILHAFGAISGVMIQNALLAAFASVAMWIVSFATNVPNWQLWTEILKGDITEKVPYPLLVTAVKALRVIHRILPRPTDLLTFSDRILTRKVGVAPYTMASELELVGNTVGWWILALVLAVLVVRKRDF